MANIVRYDLSVGNLHIFDSYQYPGKDFRTILSDIKFQNPGAFLFKARCICGMCLEWATHNFLYKIGYQRERTQDVDLDYPQKWYYKIGYSVIGVLVYPIVWY